MMIFNKGENMMKIFLHGAKIKFGIILKGKIYDSTITIVLVSPNMKENCKWQRSQWIPGKLVIQLKNQPGITE